jgi:hypothetical protein
MRSTKKLLAKMISSLGLMARVRLGMIWSKALKAAGWTAERITATLAKRLGQEAAERVAAQVAAQAAARAGTSFAIGPLTALDLGVGITGLVLDMKNVGNWMEIDERQTSDLLYARAQTEADLKNQYIGGFKNDDGVVDPSTAVGFYPVYWGPLDEFGDTVTDEGIDLFDVTVETKMFELLFAEEPDPFIVKLLQNVARNYGVSSTDPEQLFNVSLLNDMTQDDYWGLYDRAFDSLCTENGGVLIDPGVAGRPKQCSHASETACHAKSEWDEEFGLKSDDNTDVTYTEWRDRDFFNKNYSPASVPAGVAGACIIQDPSFHHMCSFDSICMKRASGQQCGKNAYIRNRGICVNTEDLCHKAGVSYCSRMRQRGGSGEDCKTALDETQADLGDYANILLPGETLPSCYKSTGDNWAEFFLGSTIYRYFKSGAAINDLAVGLIGGDPAVVSFQNTGNPDQGLANLAQAMNLQAQGQAAAAAATAQQCTLNGGRYLNGVCYTCPAGQQVSPVYGPYDAGLQSYPITGYTCVAAPTQQAPQQPWQHAATPTPPGVQAASLPVQTSTVSGSQTCPAGSVNSGIGCLNGYCGANTPCLTCPAGQTLSSDNMWCYTCPAGSSWQGSTLGCVTGTAPFTETSATRVIGTRTCPNGAPFELALNSPGYCSPVPPLVCPNNSTQLGSDCYTCPTGASAPYIRGGPGDVVCKTCPSGYTLNSDKSACTRN